MNPLRRGFGDRRSTDSVAQAPAGSLLTRLYEANLLEVGAATEAADQVSDPEGNGGGRVGARTHLRPKRHRFTPFDGTGRRLLKLPL